MLFTSYAFLFFLACLVLVYYRIPGKYQWMLLLAASFGFYASFGPQYLIYIVITIVSTWLCGRGLDQNLQDQKRWLEENKGAGREEKKQYKAGRKAVRSRMQALCIVFNLGILAVVKYANFFIGNLNGVLSLLGQGELSFVSIALPLGISFYTLQAIGYLVDVGRCTTEAERDLFKVALFISFFPQVIQGPISRFGDLRKSLFASHPYDPQVISFGLERILWGFFKKLIIADRLSPFVVGVTSDVSSYGGVYVAVTLILYTIQLYADFTGGIDITIGVAEMLGITVQENFLRPYFSTSLKEYWRRWHISMCSWFRDYVFYPVSTSRSMQNFSKFLRKRFGTKAGKRLPVYVSSFVVWFATGIWHGASWNFIVWGLLNFAILMISEELEPAYESFHQRWGLRERRWYQRFMMARTFLLVCVLNLFDCYASVGETLGAFGSVVSVPNYGLLFSREMDTFGLGVSDFAVVLVGVIVMFAVSKAQEKEWVRERIARLDFWQRAFIWSGLFVVVLIFGAYGIGYDSAQFIYNRF